MITNPFHKPIDLTEEFPTDERCHILELLHNHTEAAFSIARARVEPQITTAWHYLVDTTEHYYILEGKGLMEIAEEDPFAVFPGSIVTIPAGKAQRITNTDIEEDLIFLAVCSPAFTDQAYVSCE